MLRLGRREAGLLRQQRRQGPRPVLGRHRRPGPEARDRRRVRRASRPPRTPRRCSTRRTARSTRWSCRARRRRRRSRSNVTVKVDNRVEWQQIFDECWRVMKYRFYDEKMHGRGLGGDQGRRTSRCSKYVGENEDVYDIANEMIGELNASHTGVSGPPSREMPAAYTHAPARLRAGGRRRGVQDLARLPERPGRQGVARPEGRRLRARDRRHADQGRRQLLAAAERVR